MKTKLWIYGSLAVFLMGAFYLVRPVIEGCHVRQAQIAAAMMQIRAFQTALEILRKDNGDHQRGANGLVALVQLPINATNWRGPYLEIQEIPMDPWGNEYIYECPGKHNPSSFDLMSMGPDGRAGTKDDITNWQTTEKR